MSRRTKREVAGWILLAWSLGLGCSTDRFECSDDASCVVEGIDGFCEANGFCSFPDEECASGRRYGQMAPAEFAGVCVGATGSTGTDVHTGTSPATGGTTSSSGSSSEGDSTTEVDESTTTTAASDTDTDTDTTGPPEPQPNVVFVSTMDFDINDGELDVAGVDEDCNERARLAGFDGEFVAWLPDGDMSALDRLGSARGWVRPDGRPFADRRVDLIAGRIFYPPVLDEAGEEYRVNRVLTGTNDDGSVGFDCSGWEPLGGLMTVGSPGATAPIWTDDVGLPCDTNLALAVYCFGIDADVPVSFVPEQGRRAFVTREPIAGDVGLDEMDQRCMDDANDAMLGGPFLALVATSTGSALGRFNTDGDPWVNMRGVPLSESAGSLGSVSHLDVSPAVTASGDVLQDAAWFWTGAPGVTAVGTETDTCDDWGSGKGTGSRFPVSESTNWFDSPSLPVDCSSAQHLVCLETTTPSRPRR